MQEIIEVVRDNLKKYVVYWQYDHKLKNWKLYLKYQQDDVGKKLLPLLRPPSSVVTTSVYGKIEIDKTNTSDYVALIPRDTNNNLKINTPNDDDSYIAIGRFASIELAMQSVLDTNNPLGAPNIRIQQSSVNGRLEGC